MSNFFLNKDSQINFVRNVLLQMWSEYESEKICGSYLESV